MRFRYLGNSGLKISEITYGNWLTHGSQVENDIATQCVRAALDEGITTFDTADVYANTKAETVLGEALKGERRESLEIFTKVFWPTGPGGPNDTGLSRKHIMESINGSLSRLQTDYVDLYYVHYDDQETPLEESLRAFDALVTDGVVRHVAAGQDPSDPDECRLQEAEAAPAAGDPGQPGDVLAAREPGAHRLEDLVVGEAVDVDVEADVVPVQALDQTRQLLGRGVRADQVVDPHRAAATPASSSPASGRPSTRA